MTSPYQPAGYGEVPLSAPYYGASLRIATARFFQKYATFTGRASLSEYWWAVLMHAAVGIVLYALALIIGIGGAVVSDGRSAPGPLFIIPVLLIFVWFLGTIVPTLAIVWRRLHDAGFSGAFYFLAFVPFGGIAVLVFTLLPSKPEGARFDYPGYVPPTQYPGAQYPQTQYPGAQYPPSTQYPAAPTPPNQYPPTTPPAP